MGREMEERGVSLGGEEYDSGKGVRGGGSGKGHGWKTGIRSCSCTCYLNSIMLNGGLATLCRYVHYIIIYYYF